jgi:hypothetical protein
MANSPSFMGHGIDLLWVGILNVLMPLSPFAFQKKRLFGNFLKITPSDFQ